MDALVEVKEFKGSKYINFASRFNVANEEGQATDGKRVNLTQKDGVPRVNVTWSVAEAREAVASAIEEEADVINMSFTINRADNGKPCKKLARLVGKKAYQAGALVTRLGDYFYASKR